MSSNQTISYQLSCEELKSLIVLYCKYRISELICLITCLFLLIYAATLKEDKTVYLTSTLIFILGYFTFKYYASNTIKFVKEIYLSYSHTFQKQFLHVYFRSLCNQHSVKGHIQEVTTSVQELTK